jgi:hypothetical protein
MINLEIPDPFETFVAAKYANKRGAEYNFFEGTWTYRCGTCSETLDGPNKKTLTKIRLYHTRNECLGGY